MTTKTMRCLAVQGEVEDRTPAPDGEPPNRCAVTAVLAAEDGSRVQLEIHDWTDAATYVQGNSYTVTVVAA